MSNQKTVNIDFDVFENDVTYDSESDAESLISRSKLVPSDDYRNVSMPTLGVSLPLDKSDENLSSDGYKMIRSHQELAKQNFKNLMLTSPGEKVMDPNFGVGLRRYIFENETGNLGPSLRARIQKQTRKYLPYITLGRVEVGAQGNLMAVSVQYLITPLNVEEIFNYSISTTAV